MSVLIKKPGILSTIQDLGRYKYRQFGINPNGVMDSASARLANILVGNNEESAVLEMHFPAAEIEFDDDRLSVITGAEMRPELDGAPLENWRPFICRKGNVLRLREKRVGSRAYLAVCGGFPVPEWLGSASTNLLAKMGGKEGGPLKAGQRLEFGNSRFDPLLTRRRLSYSLVPAYSDFPTVRIVAGAEFDRLNSKGKESLLQTSFEITTESNRMGFRLKGGKIGSKGNFELVSSAVDRGTIQLLPDGRLILLMADHQTTGGYPRVANVITVDVPLAAQLGPGDKIAFELVSMDEAQLSIRRFEYEVNRLKWGCRLTNKGS